MPEGERAERFTREGYVVERSLFSRTEMHELIEEIRSAYASDPRESNLNQGALRF